MVWGDTTAGQAFHCVTRRFSNSRAWVTTVDISEGKENSGDVWYTTTFLKSRTMSKIWLRVLMPVMMWGDSFEDDVFGGGDGQGNRMYCPGPSSRMDEELGFREVLLGILFGVPFCAYCWYLVFLWVFGFPTHATVWEWIKGFF